MVTLKKAIIGADFASVLFKYENGINNCYFEKAEIGGSSLPFNFSEKKRRKRSASAFNKIYSVL